MATFFGFLINPPSAIDNTRRWPKMAEANAVCPKFQMRFKLRIAAELRNNDVITSNRAPTASVNGAIETAQVT